MSSRNESAPIEAVNLPSTTYSHRLPTVSASVALQLAQHGDPKQVIPLGLPKLDGLLGRAGDPSSQASDAEVGIAINQGLRRGEITEIFGPPGVGKTAFAIQASAAALSRDESVVWLDCATPLAGPRIRAVVKERLEQAVSADDDGASEETLNAKMDELQHFVVPSLAHLMALLVFPPPGFPGKTTSLIVIESWAVLLQQTYPLKFEDRFPGASQEISSNRVASLSARRKICLARIASSIAQLAATRNIAVVCTTHGVTKMMRDGSPAHIVPAIGDLEWTRVVHTRVSLFRESVAVDMLAEEMEILLPSLDPDLGLDEVEGQVWRQQREEAWAELGRPTRFAHVSRPKRLSNEGSEQLWLRLADDNVAAFEVTGTGMFEVRLKSGDTGAVGVEAAAAAAAAASSSTPASSQRTGLARSTARMTEPRSSTLEVTQARHYAGREGDGRTAAGTRTGRQTGMAEPEFRTGSKTAQPSSSAESLSLLPVLPAGPSGSGGGGRTRPKRSYDEIADSEAEAEAELGPAGPDSSSAYGSPWSVDGEDDGEDEDEAFRMVTSTAPAAPASTPGA